MQSERTLKTCANCARSPACSNCARACIAPGASTDSAGYGSACQFNRQRDAQSAAGRARGADHPGFRNDAIAGLRHSRGFLQAQINSQLRMKRTPHLDFVYDDTTERAARLTRLIDEATK